MRCKRFRNYRRGWCPFEEAVASAVDQIVREALLTAPGCGLLPPPNSALRRSMMREVDAEKVREVFSERSRADHG